MNLNPEPKSLTETDEHAADMDTVRTKMLEGHQYPAPMIEWVSERDGK